MHRCAVFSLFNPTPTGRNCKRVDLLRCCGSLITFFLLTSVLWCSCGKVVPNQTKSGRLYANQFFQKDAYAVLPDILFFSVYLQTEGGHVYNHLSLLVESMRLNPKVQFVVVNIASNQSIGFGADIQRISDKFAARNVRILPENISSFQERLFSRLNIRVNFTDKWFYKLCDYKPTLSYLYPELLSERPYSYWGYGDVDIIWGNFSRFAHLFQGQYDFVITGDFAYICQICTDVVIMWKIYRFANEGWFSVNGMATFFRNNRKMRE